MRALSFLFLGLSLTLILSCKKKQEINQLNIEKSRTYFSAFSRGVIKDNEVIEFRLIEKATITESDLASAFVFSPKVNFTASYADTSKRRILLKPTQSWQRGAKYALDVKLDKIFSSASGDLTIDYKVLDQSFEITREGLSVDDDGAGMMIVNVSCELDEKIENIKELFDYPKTALVVEENSPRDYIVNIKFSPEQKQKEINWNGQKFNSEDKGTIQFWNYNGDNFEVVHGSHRKSEASFVIYFSKILDPKQDIKGLVKLDKESADYRIEKNTIVVNVPQQNKQDVILKLQKGIKDVKGNKLKSNFEYTIELGVVRPEVSWLSSGTYIPNSGKFLVPFRAKGLKGVHLEIIGIPSENAANYSAWNDLSSLDKMEIKRFGRPVFSEWFDLTKMTSSSLNEWNEFGIDLSERFNREKGMVYHLSLDFDASHTTIISADTSFYSKVKLNSNPEDFYDEPYGYYGRRYYGYDYRERNNPLHSAYYWDRSASRNVHCTNVFPIFKWGNSTFHVAAKELLSSNLVSGARIDVLNLQGLVIESGSTSDQGFAQFRNLKQRPRAVRINYNGETSYFSVHSNHQNGITEFDVSSKIKDVDSRLFVYTERNIWRPGDSIYLDVMLNKVRHQFVNGVPLVVELINPKNVKVQRFVKNIADGNAIYNFTLKSSLDDPTGFWKAKISLGPLTIYKTLRIETIKPNVVDLQYSFAKVEENWVYNEFIEGDVKVDYLVGYPMSKGKVSGSANFIQIKQPFEEFKNFNFGPHEQDKSRRDQQILSVTTKNDGSASFRFNRSLKEYKGVVKVIIDSKIDLPGGGLNTETESKLFSPFKSYVGIEKSRGKGWDGTFSYGNAPVFRIVNLDQKGKLLSDTREVKIEQYKYEKDWWYDRNRMSRNYSYSQGYKSTLVKKENVKIINGKGEVKHKNVDNASGVFRMVITDLQSGHITEYHYRSINAQNYTDKTNPVTFNIETDKERYKAGENVKLKLPLVQEARALVSVEAGDRVMDMFWVSTDGGTISLEANEDWFPNVFLHVSIIQNYGQEYNDRPLRMYSVHRIHIDELEYAIDPEINISPKIKPNTLTEFNVSESHGEPMEYTIAVVDNGLLNLTGFSSPDPRSHFSKERALTVKTWDIFANLIKYMNPSFAGILSIGGDAALKQSLNESADFNRFKPVVFHMGPFHLRKGETKSHQLDMPNYIGSLRFMVVATNDRTFGNTEKNVRVANPLMLQSQLPRTLNVGDKVEIPITLFRDEKSIGKVQLKASASEGVSWDVNAVNIEMGIGDQATQNMVLNVANAAGPVDLRLDATSGNFSSFEEQKIFVNYPNSYSTQTKYFELDPGQKSNLDIRSFGFPETQSVTLEVSGVLLPKFSQYTEDLISYPHGCLEQTTSKAMSMLYLPELIVLPLERKMACEKFLDIAVKKITSYQKSNGQFNYWQNGYYNDWSNSYAGYFLLEARDRGHKINDAVINKYLNFLKERCNGWGASNLSSRRALKREEVLQAFRLFVLAKAGKPAKSAMNRLVKKGLTSSMARVLMAGAYQMAGMKSNGEQLLNKALTSSDFTWNSYGFGSVIRNEAMTIYVLSLFNRSEDARRLYFRWIEKINKRRWVSTQEMGWSFMACSQYANGNANATKEIDVEIKSKSYSERKKQKGFSPFQLVWDKGLPESGEIINHGNGKAFYSLTQKGIDDNLYQEAYADKISTTAHYYDLNSQPLDLKNIKQGQDIRIVVTVKNFDIIDQENLALILKCPSGWELINPRLYMTNAGVDEMYIYQDFQDDRVYTYLNLPKGKSQNYTFRAKASLKGDYYLPAVVCENMYDGDVGSKTKARRVQVR